MALKTSIFSMFGRSPIGSIEEHMKKVHACAEVLIPFFDAVLAKDWSRAEQLQTHISHLEHEADEIKKDLRLHLPKSLFLPVSRSDVLELLTIQDSVANQAKDIAGLILGRHMQFPDSLAEQFKIFLQRSVAASGQAAKAIGELDDLLETGFQGSEVELVESMIHELDQIEHDTDEMQIKIRRGLFDLENQLTPVHIMFLYKIIEWIGDLADRAQQVGERMQLLLAR
jgi:predicted phosphate transport protein (TIGR00153 family)